MIILRVAVMIRLRNPKSLIIRSLRLNNRKKKRGIMRRNMMKRSLKRRRQASP